MGVTLKYLHGGHAPFQIDANMGFTAAIYETLMYSDTTKIKLLPALPEVMREGRIENIHARGGICVTIEWNESTVKALLSASADKDIHVGAPVGYTLNSPEKHTESRYGKDFINLSLKNGESIVLEYTK